MRAPKQGTEIRKSQIARAVLDQIASHGMKGLNMAAVAHRVGVVPSALYRHFRSKEEMLQAVFEQIGEGLERNVQAVCDENPDALERLHALLMLNVRMVREFHAIPRIMFAEGAYSESSRRKARVYEVIRKYLARVGAIVEEGQKAGRIRPELDPSTVATAYWGLIPPATVLWYVSEGRFDVGRQVERAWRLLLDAIEVRSAGGRA